jgi:hypothetical protein
MAWIIRSSKGCLGIGGSAGPETIGVDGWEGIGYLREIKLYALDTDFIIKHLSECAEGGTKRYPRKCTTYLHLKNIYMSLI